MRFIAVLDDCNDSKESGNDQMQEEGERKGKNGRKGKDRKESERRKERETKGEWSEGERKKRERKGEGKRGSEGERKGKDRKESERGRKSALGERGARSTCTLYERNPRRRRWAVVHFMHDSARLY